MAQLLAAESDVEARTDVSFASGASASAAERERALARYCRKVDCRILAYAMVLNVLNQCDRGSIGVAKVVGLEKDLGMVKNDFNIAATLFSVGFIAVEPFSNLVLKRVGASRLLPTLGILWGTVSALHGVVSTKGQLYAMRVLLGMTECGFLAGIYMLMVFFYPKHAVTVRAGVFGVCTPVASVLSGPLASALSQIHHPTIRRWQWVFILEGAITVAVSLLGYSVLQDHPEGCRFLTADERKLIIDHKRREGAQEATHDLTMSDIGRVLADWQLWAMTVPVFSASEIIGTVVTFAPQVINELGFTPAQSQAISALPAFCGAVVVVLSGWIVRMSRGHWIVVSALLATALCGCVIMVSTLSIAARILGLCLLGAGGFPAIAVAVGWIITTNTQTVANAAVATGLSGAIAMCANFVSSNVFLNSDAPRFVIGYTVNIVILVIGIAACFVVRVSMDRRNRQMLAKQPQHGTIPVLYAL
ncbi:hypothetical protein H4R19_001593 [Coemansia spiralis]|nr:hypothetical protein H4R19_001593 [Coemansia spiralis]